MGYEVLKILHSDFLVFLYGEFCRCERPKPSPRARGPALVGGRARGNRHLGVQEKKEEILIQVLGKKMQDPDPILHFPSLLIEPLAYLL